MQRKVEATNKSAPVEILTNQEPYLTIYIFDNLHNNFLFEFRTLESLNKLDFLHHNTCKIDSRDSSCKEK